MEMPVSFIIQEPEQEQPIDYHVPKRHDDKDDENEERRHREQRRSQCSKVSKPLLIPNRRGMATLIAAGKWPVMTSAAAGHGRTTNNGAAQGGGNQSSGGTTGGGGSISFSGGSSGGGGGAIGGGTGSGGMNPGRDGRQNYGPSSPPTGSLPPFYESLKGGGNTSGNYNGNFTTGNGYLLNNQQNMDCDTGQELASLSMAAGGGHSPPKQYSTLQNAAYGLVMKDEGDLEIYDTKIDAMNNLFPGSYSGYEDTMMVDMPSTVVDPLQFTATLTFSSSAEQALLESLTDANDLSSYLQRLPNDDNDSDEIISNEMNNSDSSQLQQQQQQQQVDHLDNFQEHMINRNYERGYPPQFTKIYQDQQLPSYQSSESLHVQMQQQQPQQQQQMLSPTLSFNGSTLDMDSPTALSLPSPGAASCSLDGGSHNESGGSISPPDTVSGRRDSVSSDTPSLQGRVNLLQQRVSINNLIQPLKSK